MIGDRVRSESSSLIGKWNSWWWREFGVLPVKPSTKQVSPFMH